MNINYFRQDGIELSKNLLGDSNVDIETAKRIKIDYAKEAKDYLWRFFIKSNKYVSVNK